MELKDSLIDFIKGYKILPLIIIVIIISGLIYYFLYIYMRNTEKRVVVFDLDETLGCFVELGIFCDIIEKYKGKKLTPDEFNALLDIFPEFFRPNVLPILKFLKEKKQQGLLYKVYLYTNNQGPKEWAENIIAYLEKKINYKLFDKVIGAYKVNGKIVENTRSTHDKTLPDFFRSTDLWKDTKICFVDDLYHPKMDGSDVYYINIVPYVVSIPFNVMAERYYNENAMNINKYNFINYIVKHMNRYNTRSIFKSVKDKNNDNIESKKLLHHLQHFLKINKKSKYKTKKHTKKVKRKNITHKFHQ
jgi:hypothetical protein